MREWLGVYLRGLAMGSADAVPGVSGGTIALVTGIYDRLIAAVTAVTPGRVLAVLRGVLPDGRAEARTAFVAMDGGFLLALGTGVLSAIVTVSQVLDVALDRFPVVTFAFFFGLIAASALVLYGELHLDSPPRWVAAAGGVLLAYVVSGETTAGMGSSLPMVFLAGSVAVSAMILPGISGSLLLIILGQYEFLVETLSEFVHGVAGLATGGGLAALVPAGAVVLTFGVGAVVGLFTVAHAVRWALARYRELTMTFLVSLIVGALRAPVVEMNGHVAARGGWTAPAVGAAVVAAAVGVVTVVGVERYAGGVTVDR